LKVVDLQIKRRTAIMQQLRASKSVNADATQVELPPELNEFLHGEDAGQVLDTAAILDMASF
jgi:hypothetical protein